MRYFLLFLACSFPKQYNCLLCLCKLLSAASKAIRHLLHPSSLLYLQNFTCSHFFFFEIFLLCIPGWPQAHYVAHSHSPVSASRLWDYRGKAPQLTLICYVNYKHFPHWFLGTHVLVFPQKDNIINREPKTASEAVAIPMVVRIRTISKQSCTEHPDNGCLEWAHLGISIPGSGSHLLSPDTVGWTDSSISALHLSLISYTERVQRALRRTSHYHTYG